MIYRRLISLATAGAFAMAVPVLSHGAPAWGQGAAKEPLPVRKIAIVVNGQELAADPSPRIVNGHLLVPIVRVLGSLAITVSREGRDVIAQAPNKTIRLTIGSNRAFVDNQSIGLEEAPVEIGGTTYVPLRFVVDALGANATYNAQTSRIDIVSAIVRRENSTPQNVGSGKTKITGTLSALDLNSTPPSMSVTYRESVRTIAINSTAKVVVQDVVARSQQNGRISDLHVGDAVAVTMAKDGSVETIQDMYGSRTGTVAAASASAIVLDSGQVITPDKTTEITLNGNAAPLGDLHVGDTVTQRSNPETGETRQIIASRKITATPPPADASAAPNLPPSNVTISSLQVAPGRPLRMGESFTITMRGTPGGKATFDLGSFMSGAPLQEESPGNYVGKLPVEPGMNFTYVPVFGHLSVGGVDAARAEAPVQISSATIAPQITDVAPGNGQVVNNNRPSIYATFAAPTDLGISTSSVTLKVNGSDVTTSSTRTTSFLTYTAGQAIPDGQVTVTVSVSDLAGNSTSRSWTFTIRTR